jgi:hypothetical protein
MLKSPKAIKNLVHRRCRSISLGLLEAELGPNKRGKAKKQVQKKTCKSKGLSFQFSFDIIFFRGVNPN